VEKIKKFVIFYFFVDFVFYLWLILFHSCKPDSNILNKGEVMTELYLQQFISQCREELPAEKGVKFSGEALVTFLVLQGLKTLLPELKKWLHLGIKFSSLQRQILEQKLKDYALKKELDYPEAEKAARIISDKINGENLAKIVAELEKEK